MRKKIKKIFLFATLIAISVVSVNLSSFAENFIPMWYSESKSLYNLGLYKGISNDTFEPDLSAKLDRQTGVIMVLRLFGEEGNAVEMNQEEAYRILKKSFDDAHLVKPWAVRQLAYALEKGIVKGFPDKKIKPSDPLTGRSYCAMLLNKLGYKFKYEDSGIYFAEAAKLDPAQIFQFGVNLPINKDTMVGISFSTLRASFDSSQDKVIDSLVKSGIVDVSKAKKEWIIKDPK